MLGDLFCKIGSFVYEYHSCWRCEPEAWKPIPKEIKKPDIFKIAKKCARQHCREDPDTIAVYLSPHDEEIRLIEVAEEIETTNAIFPIKFAPGSKVPFESIVILISPNEWDSIKRGAISLPKGWDKDSLIKIV